MRAAIVRLWEMLELNANSFVGAATQLARLHAITAGYAGRDEVVLEPTIEASAPRLEQFAAEAQNLGAKLSAIHAARLLERLRSNPVTITVSELSHHIGEVESRFADHLMSVQLFALTEAETQYVKAGQELLGQQICDRLPSVIYEMEEAAKCLALSRPTACVFHCMRALEPPIRALATFLGTPDPTKPAEKNWGYILGEIQKKMDSTYPKNKRMPGTDGAIVEAIFVTLDSIKNPWRNSTMHTEATYQPFEAAHILQCVNVFLLKVSSFVDENGARV